MVDLIMMAKLNVSGIAKKCSRNHLSPLTFPCSELVISVTRKFAEKIKKAMLYHVVDYGNIEEIEENTNKAKNALDIYAKKLGVKSECIQMQELLRRKSRKSVRTQFDNGGNGKVGRGWLGVST